ncbi:hypothetical protein BDV96DRAFT_502540 [Lophiotrema nucula]|uniref:Aminoglycoside phosphotransferase domain-containing protein n=1 Tax=Lophiotrema nucula TaxID=690887 RepID=A0A6A5YRK8_9PLEO|nr:hypothetical protein BDV96DRAFT_502540 [Lophiotrema nucula]
MAAIQLPSPQQFQLQNKQEAEASEIASQHIDQDDHGCESDCECDAQTESETSTVEYEHEPYETFKDKARQLIVGLFPHSIIEVERLQGGSFNRVIGVSVSSKTSSKHSRPIKKFFQDCLGIRPNKNERNQDRQFILRIPRNDVGSVPYETAILSFIAGRVSFPVPRTLLHDTTDQNALHMPYVLQPRLSGHQLEHIWDSLNFDQKKGAVRQVTQIIVELSNITSASAGLISPHNSASDFQNTVQTETTPVPEFGVSTLKAGELYTFPAKPQTTYRFIVSQCERWRAYESRDGEVAWNKIWDGLIAMASKLHELGFLPDDEVFHFAHQDLVSRNVLVEIRDTTSVHITGVLDWDLASFAPKFMSCRAPFFFWAEQGTDEDDEDQVHAKGDNEEETEFKKMFEEMVSPDFLRYAYGEEYILARRMWPYLRRGIQSQYELERAKELVEDFHNLHSLGPNVSESLAMERFSQPLDLSSS